MDILEVIVQSYERYSKYISHSITHPFEKNNYLFFFLVATFIVWGLELIVPWRKEQRFFRKQFWQDAFYSLFNLILFNLIAFAALSNVTAELFEEFMGLFGSPLQDSLNMSKYHWGIQIAVYFLLYDFIQWCIHNALHRIPFLWRFHQVHHSSKNMSVLVHFRFHFMEIVFYRIGLYIFLAYLFNFKLQYAFYMYAFATIVGHLNHANLGWDYGPLKYIFNNPKMHIWHHAKEMPGSHPKGMNFGLSLSIWDYIFRTAYIPHNGRDIELGFTNDEDYPKSWFGQIGRAFRIKRS